ncbi:MAG: fibrillarin-like rRNA/tRNA 2'-O-methyltransferase [Thermoplasmata archaeon]|nr:fibrillarin-like rRNA/tRNA 2'-O-methyltransferase [Thermoplasmata archaeon]
MDCSFGPAMAIRPTAWDGVYTDGPWLLTKNRVPGRSVYGESLPREAGIEYRRWDANRSKLAAYLRCGGQVWPFRPATSVLYLGAGTGTTVSHLSDVCAQGSITAVEVSPRAFRNLLSLAEYRPNVLPVLGDATKPESYAGRIGAVDALYQDVAQRDQGSIFVRNATYLRSGGIGFLMVKSRSRDVAAQPRAVYDEARTELREAGLDALELRPLDPFETDHAALVVRKP